MVKRDTHIVFKPENDDANIGGLGLKYYWEAMKFTPADPENSIPYKEYFKAEDDDYWVIYVEDPVSECNFVIVYGEEMDKAVSLIKEETEYWSDEEMFDDWRNASHDSAQISAILRLGVGAPFEYDSRYAEIFKEGLTHSDEAIRDASIVALTYRGWKEFDPALENMSQSDDSEKCRRRASAMLNIIQKERKKQSQE